MNFDDLELPEPPILPGDPTLRTLIGLVDSGEARGVQVVINAAGQMIAGTLISAAEYAAAADDVVTAWGMNDEATFLMRQTLLLGSMDEGSDDPYGYTRADHVHVLRPDVMPFGSGEPQLWRSPIEAVYSWSI